MDPQLYRISVHYVHKIYKQPQFKKQATVSAADKKTKQEIKFMHLLVESNLHWTFILLECTRMSTWISDSYSESYPHNDLITENCSSQTRNVTVYTHQPSC